MMYVFLDPGESTGWMVVDSRGEKACGVLEKASHAEVWKWLYETIGLANGCLGPQSCTIVYEGFHLFGSHKNVMVGNSFYTCEIIGVIKLFAEWYVIDIKEQMPSDKKYAGKLEEDYKKYKTDSTQHSKDAWLHYQFFKRRHKLDI